MPDLLFELFSEEIPARMQKQAAEDVRRLVTNALVEAGVTYEGAQAFATPRRLALHIVGLPARQPDTREERKGPRVGAPEAALAGFLKSAGLTDISQATIESDPKKGEFYVAVIEKPGRPLLELLADILPATIRAFPWPKSMRWGAASATPGSLRWVRPLRSILATFGSEHEEPEIVPFEVDGLKAGNVTFGHRFMAPEAISVRRFEDYVAKLHAANVVLDSERRKAIIRHDARNLAFAQGLELVEDEGLLDEVAGLVEWPMVLTGAFEEAFLDVPAEVIRATIRANQKCFVLKKPDGSLANRFLLTANIVPADEGKVIVAGNERVIRARLSDAKFFWEQDKKVWEADKKDLKRLERFKSVTFHEKLGSQWDRIERIQRVAFNLCGFTGAAGKDVLRASQICKADLLTQVVGEFPEVQGLMGRIYAQYVDEPPSVAAACEEHYKPIGSNDSVPSDPVSVTVGLADKLDTLAGFWAIDEKPTGSKDPYALRRAALGVVALTIQNEIKIPLFHVFHHEITRHLRHLNPEMKEILRQRAFYRDSGSEAENAVHIAKLMDREAEILTVTREVGAEKALDLLRFFHERLKVILRDRGFRHDLVDAVLRQGGRPKPAQAPSFIEPYWVRYEGLAEDDELFGMSLRVEALGKFLETEDGKSLLAGFRRAANILRAEEKKDGEGAFEAAAEPALLVEPAEKSLADALSLAGEAAAVALERQDYEAAMRAMAALRAPVDAFFEAVLVNAEDAALRRNRLALLAGLRRVTRQVADFGKVAG